MTPRPTRSLSLAALVAVAALSAGCRRAAPPPPVSPGDHYVARGEIARLAPPEAGPGLSIRHEAIPDFRDRTGAVVGMSSMVMHFPVAEGVSLAGLAPGDKIRFRFVMDWEATRFEIESIEKLPPDTALDFGGAAH